jgi:hypothetical protein
MTQPNPQLKRNALLALLLLLPVPSVGVLMMLFVFPGTVGKVIAFVCKAWITLLPLIWYMKVDRQRAHFPKPTRRGMGAAIISGAAIFAAMLLAYHFAKAYVPIEPLREKAAATGFDNKTTYIAMFIYIIVVNSLLEEYVWRWFVFSKLEVLLPGPLAVIIAGLCFTIHHIFALAAWVPPTINAIACVGVFIGGTT